MVVTLAERGLIQRTPGQARSLRVLLPAEALPDLESGRAPMQSSSDLEAKYPHLARWIKDGGWVELGRTDYGRSMARALDEGGMVWEGRDSYASLEEILKDLDQGIALWMEENA
jgi:hypothetical protein